MGGKSAVLRWGAREIEVDAEPEALSLMFKTVGTILVQTYSKGTGDSNVALKMMTKLWQD